MTQQASKSKVHAVLTCVAVSAAFSSSNCLHKAANSLAAAAAVLLAVAAAVLLAVAAAVLLAVAAAVPLAVAVVLLAAAVVLLAAVVTMSSLKATSTLRPCPLLLLRLNTLPVGVEGADSTVVAVAVELLVLPFVAVVLRSAASSVLTAASAASE
jgi:hypothetical protein